MKIWSAFFLLIFGLCLVLAGPAGAGTGHPSRLAGVTPLGPILAMLACAEFPDQPLREPAPDAGDGQTDSSGFVGDDAPADGAAPDSTPDRDVGGPPDDTGAVLPREARIGGLDGDQLQIFCLQLEEQLGSPAGSGMCEGRTLWPAAVSCEVTVQRMAECGATVGEYDDCLALARDNPCSLLHAPACDAIFDCLGTGLDPGASIGSLPQVQFERMCRWGVEALGENREFFCDGIIRVNTHTVEDCEQHDRSSCTLTVREYEDCATHILDDICLVLNAPICAPFRACFGPEL